MPSNNSPLPDFPVDGNSPTFDLATTALWREVLEAAGLTIEDSELRERFRDSIDDLVEDIATSIGDYQAGYLIRINIWISPNGDAIVPGGELITPIGLGSQPIEALAEFYRTPGSSIAAPSRGGEDHSFFFWLTADPEPHQWYNVPTEVWSVLQDRGFDPSVVELAIRRIIAFIDNVDALPIANLLAPTVAFYINGETNELSGADAARQLAILRHVPNAAAAVGDAENFIVRSDELGLASGMVWVATEGDKESGSLGVRIAAVNIE